jgi:hypothetical protein
VIQARVTSAVLEVLVEAEASARTSSLALEVLHSVQEGAPPPPPPSGLRRAVVIVMG